MKKILAGLVALTLVGSTALVTMTPAEAQGYGYRGWGYGGWGLGLGVLAAGAVIGSALASPYYGYSPGYSYGYAPGYSYGYAPGYSYGYAPGYSYGYAPGYNYGFRRAYYGYGPSDLPLNFHPAAFRASTNVTPFDAVSVPA